MPQSERALESAIQELLIEWGTPVNPVMLFDKLSTQYPDIDGRSIRDAIWRLIAEQKIELSPSRELKAIAELA